jgi:hypothetical protein
MGEMRNVYNIWLESLKGRDHSEDKGVDGRISGWMFGEIGLEFVDRMHLAAGRDQWQALVYILMNLRAL